MTSIIIVVVVMACASWMAWSRWTYWRTPIGALPSAEVSPQTRAFEAFTHGNTCLAAGQFADATRHVGTTWLCDTARHTLCRGWVAPRQYGRRPCICVCHAAAARGREPWSSVSVGHLSYPYPESPAASRGGGTSAARHLPGCVPAVPDAPGCEAVRAEFGICPDHDGLCAPGCPVGRAGGDTD